MHFRWIDWNRDQIAEHGVEPAEAEAVVRNPEPKFPRKIEGGDGPQADLLEHLSVFLVVHLANVASSAAIRCRISSGIAVFLFAL